MDCTNMVTYMLEEKRMCEFYYKEYGCEKCPFSIFHNCGCRKLFNNQNKSNYDTANQIKYNINIVQKWSDEHREE